MKKKILALVAAAGIWCMQLGAFAEESASAEEAASDPTILQKLIPLGKFTGYFLLVMAVIYAALLLTNWIGKKTNKH